MSKIEKFKSIKQAAAQIEAAVNRCTGRDSPSNNKARISVRFVRLHDDLWSSMLFLIEASHGYHGSLSSYSDTSKELGEYLAKAIAMKKVELFDLAAELAAKDAEKARKEAEEEAKSVLADTSPAAA